MDIALDSPTGYFLEVDLEFSPTWKNISIEEYEGVIVTRVE